MKTNKFFCRFALMVAVIFYAGAGMAEAVHLNLNWNPPADAPASGYKVYYSTTSPEGPYDAADAAEGASPLQVATENSIGLSGLSETKAYYFTVTALNADGEESTFSNVVSNHWMPELQYPANAAAQIPTNVTLSWSTPENPELYDFTLYLGTDPTAIQAAPMHLLPLKPGAWGGGSPKGGGLQLVLALTLAAGLLVQQLASSRRWLPAAALAATLLASCGGGGGGGAGGDGALVTTPDNGTAFSQDVVLEPNTTYYWRVEANNGEVVVLSELQTFTTGS